MEEKKYTSTRRARERGLTAAWGWNLAFLPELRQQIFASKTGGAGDTTC